MMPGIAILLVLILTLVLAIVSTAQAFNPFSRQPEAEPAPLGLIAPMPGQARQPYDGASLGQQPFFMARDAAHGHELWRTDEAPVSAGDRLVFAGDDGSDMVAIS